MECLGCQKQIPQSSWKVRCKPCWSENKRNAPRKAKKYNPCDHCGGEDCACCSYAHGY